MRKQLELAVFVVLGLFMITSAAIAQSETLPYEKVREKLSEVEKKIEIKKEIIKKQAQNKAETSAEQQRPKEAITKEINKILDDAFTMTVNSCQGILGKYESKATKIQIVKVSLAVVGALSGVAVPALMAAAASGNAVWAAGLGGLSGVTNAAQATLSDSGLTPAVSLQTRAQILQEFNTAINDYFDPKNDDETRMMSIKKAFTACVLHSVIVPDQKTSK